MSEPLPREFSLPPGIDSLLSRLRAQIQRYVFWEGVALTLVLMGGLFWGTFLLDCVFFTLTKLELPRWFRATFLIGGLVLLTLAALSWVIFRVFRRFRARALALVLERRFRELDDRLITAVEAAEGRHGAHDPLSQAMLTATIQQVAGVAERLDTNNVFDPVPLRRAITIAAVLTVSVLGLLVVDSSAMDRWIHGYLGLREHYWNRENELTAVVITQPGDRVHEFRQRHYRHPRGGDFTMRVDAAAGKRMPEGGVRVDFRQASGFRLASTKTGEQPLFHLDKLSISTEFWLSGGDFTDVEPYFIEVVDPPRVTDLTLKKEFPAYTGMEPRTDRVDGLDARFPVETQVVLAAATNKPLRGFRVEFEAQGQRVELEFLPRTVSHGSNAEAAAGTVTIRAEDGGTQLQAEWPQPLSQVFAKDQRGFALALQLTHDGGAKLFDALRQARDGQTALRLPLPLPAETPLRINLTDSDGIDSLEPTRLTLRGTEDEPPRIETELRGIGSAITRTARIPVRGLVTDDYGLRQVRFEYKVDNEPDWHPREFQAPPTAGTPEFHLARREREDFELFEVLPLDLSLKQKLIVTVYADDIDDLNGPHIVRGQKYVFTIVSVEELLSQLYQRELNLRRRLEQIVSELKELRQDLTTHRGKIDQRRGLAAGSPEREPLSQAIVACAERALHHLRKNATETAAIAYEIGGIREELVNNSADTPQALERIDVQIVAPLKAASNDDFPRIDSSLGLFKLANDKGTDPTTSVAEAEEDLGALIARLERVLTEMRKLETFQEAVEILKSIITGEDELFEQTKRKRKENAIKAID